MASGGVRVGCLVMLLVAMLALSNNVSGTRNFENRLSNVTIDSICCREYYNMGECIPGQNDAPGGNCYEFCIQECKGALCKQTSEGHHCHCLC
ncbi:unnamed protein product [Linum tenue]|uniref:Uncharacterized protein n=3 Tax=Linum tenue TaxID=586396 RepID=A0AAV0JJH8_9ROSI|nr:unnamed protein product [Linum tenue]